MFDIDEVVKPITYDLGIEKLNIKPRFSYQLPNTSLMSQIDEDRMLHYLFRPDEFIAYETITGTKQTEDNEDEEG